jgi:hypothetical protein
MKTVFWDVASCILVELCWRISGACCLHHPPVSISETSVNFYQTTRSNITEDSHLQKKKSVIFSELFLQEEHLIYLPLFPTTRCYASLWDTSCQIFETEKIDNSPRVVCPRGTFFCIFHFPHTTRRCIGFFGTPVTNFRSIKSVSIIPGVDSPKGACLYLRYFSIFLGTQYQIFEIEKNQNFSQGCLSKMNIFLYLPLFSATHRLEAMAWDVRPDFGYYILVYIYTYIYAYIWIIYCLCYSTLLLPG